MELSKNKKIFFLVHILITLVSFYWLVSDSGVGLGLFMFGSIQFIFSLFLCKNKKWAVLLSGSILILCASTFFRDGAFKAANYFAIAVLLAALIVLSRGDLAGFRLRDLAASLVEPFLHIVAPFGWIKSVLKNKNSNLGKAAFSGIVTLLCVSVVLILLSNADMVFSKGVSSIFSDFFDVFTPAGIFRLYMSVIVTAYIFGAFFATCRIPNARKVSERKAGLLDSFTPSVLLIALLAVYAVFCAIQIKYLFLGAKLPDGITHAEYAREGFFELLIISGINLAVVLTSFAITKRNVKPGNKLTLVLCFTLLAVTVFLLFSSFWRMYLYYLADGLTRLRTLVFIFLIFEFIGLVLTFFYIAKPKFNIIYIYFVLTLLFWLTVNTANIDRIIAKNQIDMYLDGERNDVYYVTTLSNDAAPEIARLLDNENTAPLAREYFAYIDISDSWQGMNLSDMKAKDIANIANSSHSPLYLKLFHKA